MRLWTIQPQEIGELLQAGNTFVCDEDKIDLFDVDGFREAYDWMTVKMDEHGIRRIKKAKYPVWAWHTREWKHKRPDLRLGGYGKRGDRLSCIEFEIPESEVLLSDFDAWHFVLNNLWLDGSVTEAESRKNEIYFDSLTKEEQERAKADSWNRIFVISPYENDWIVRGCYIQAVFWELRPDMVTECRFFTAK